MRFIATADWQLGMAAHFLDTDARARFHQARFDAVARIGDVAREFEAAFVVVGGDVFETNQLHRSVILRAFEALRRIDVPVVLVPGNHDPLEAGAIYDDPAFLKGCPENVVVARGFEPFEVVPGVEVVAAPWSSKRPGCDLVAEALAALRPSTAGKRVLVGHGAVASLNPDAASESAIDDEGVAEALRAGRIHFAVLGDRHSTTEVRPGLWYPGTPEVTSRRETDPGNVLAVDLDTGAVEPVRVGRWHFTTLEQELGGLTDVDELVRRLAELQDKDRTALWLVLRGTLSISAAARLEAAIDEFSEIYAHLRNWERHTDLVVVPDDHDFFELELTGYAADAVAELRERVTDDEVARDALGLLLRLTGATR